MFKRYIDMGYEFTSYFLGWFSFLELISKNSLHGVVIALCMWVVSVYNHLFYKCVGCWLDLTSPWWPLYNYWCTLCMACEGAANLLWYFELLAWFNIHTGDSWLPYQQLLEMKPECLAICFQALIGFRFACCDRVSIVTSQGPIGMPSC